MQNVDYMITFWGIALLAFLFYRNSTIEAIKKFGTITTIRSEHYCMPSRWIRKTFNLPKKEVNRYFLIRLYFAVINGLLGSTNSIIFLCSKGNTTVAHVLVVLQIGWILVDTLVFLICWRIFIRARYSTGNKGEGDVRRGKTRDGSKPLKKS